MDLGHDWHHMASLFFFGAKVLHEFSARIFWFFVAFIGWHQTRAPSWSYESFFIRVIIWFSSSLSDPLSQWGVSDVQWMSLSHCSSDQLAVIQKTRITTEGDQYGLNARPFDKTIPLIWAMINSLPSEAPFQEHPNQRGMFHQGEQAPYESRP